MNYKKELHILNLGAGVQSTAVYLMLKDKLDYAIFADTGAEPPAVYEHLKWLQSLGGAEIIVRSGGNLEEDLKRGESIIGQRFASIPAFTLKEGDDIRKKGITRRQCTRDYKICVIEKTIRREILGLKPRARVPKDVMVYQYYGISLDEARRARSIRNNNQDKKWTNPRFPLLPEDLLSFMDKPQFDLNPIGIQTRRECIEYLKKVVPHEVPRSACVFCPYHDNNEWLRMKNEDVASWNRAVEIDKTLRIPGRIINRNLTAKLYLHKSCKPLSEIDFESLAKVPQMPQFAQECEGMCGV